MGLTMAATASLLATLVTRSRCCRCDRHQHNRIVAARLCGLGAEHALAQVAHLCLCQHEIGLKLRHPLVSLGKLTVVTQLLPLQPLDSPCMQRSILAQLQLQIDILASADADELHDEGCGMRTVAHRRRRYTTAFGCSAGTAGIWAGEAASSDREHGHDGRSWQKACSTG